MDQQLEENSGMSNRLMKDYKEKGYSIYVVDDEHEIHRFDLETYEWTIISTTKESLEP
jgi:hypothetical protein